MNMDASLLYATVGLICTFLPQAESFSPLSPPPPSKKPSGGMVLLQPLIMLVLISGPILYRLVTNWRFKAKIRAKCEDGERWAAAPQYTMEAPGRVCMDGKRPDVSLDLVRSAPAPTLPNLSTWSVGRPTAWFTLGLRQNL